MKLPSAGTPTAGTGKGSKLMKELLQRLEMVKNAIMLEDEDIIDLQIMKLSRLVLDADANNILSLLKSGSYETVIRLIEDYRQSKTGLVSYDDKEVYGLRLELKRVEAEYDELSIQKVSIEALINDFNNQYYHQCGELIESILLYRAKFQKEQATANPEDEKKAEAFEEAQKDYDEFHQEYEEKSEEPLIELNQADQKKLKAAYRKASTLCHPDKVSEELKEQAGEVFKQLNEAYKAKDLNAVEEILSALQKQKGFSTFSDTVSNVEKLRSRIAKVRSQIVVLKDEISSIKDDETYQLIDEISNWDEYFKDMKVQLENELVILQDTVPNHKG